MSDTTRTIDPTRQGGTVVAVQPPLLVPEMTYAEALEYHRKFDWRLLPARSDRARQALIAEVERLKTINATLMSEGEARELVAEVERLRSANSELAREALSFEGQARESMGQLAVFRTALPDLIGCPYGDPATCTEDYHGWSPCCVARLKAVRRGLPLAIERAAEEEDGV